MKAPGLENVFLTWVGGREGGQQGWASRVSTLHLCKTSLCKWARAFSGSGPQLSSDWKNQPWILSHSVLLAGWCHTSPRGKREPESLSPKRGSGFAANSLLDISIGCPKDTPNSLVSKPFQCVLVLCQIPAPPAIFQARSLGSRSWSFLLTGTRWIPWVLLDILQILPS